MIKQQRAFNFPNTWMASHLFFLILGKDLKSFILCLTFVLLPLLVEILAMRKKLGAVLQMVLMRALFSQHPDSTDPGSKKLLPQVDNQYPFEISPSPTFTQMDPYKPQYKVPRSISEEELIR